MEPGSGIRPLVFFGFLFLAAFFLLFSRSPEPQSRGSNAGAVPAMVMKVEGVVDSTLEPNGEIVFRSLEGRRFILVSDLRRRAYFPPGRKLTVSLVPFRINERGDILSRAQKMEIR